MELSTETKGEVGWELSPPLRPFCFFDGWTPDATIKVFVQLVELTQEEPERAVLFFGQSKTPENVVTTAEQILAGNSSLGPFERELTCLAASFLADHGDEAVNYDSITNQFALAGSERRMHRWQRLGFFMTRVATWKMLHPDEQEKHIGV